MTTQQMPKIQWFKTVDRFGGVEFVGLENGITLNVDISQMRSIERVDAPPAPHPTHYVEPYRGRRDGEWYCHISF